MQENKYHILIVEDSETQAVFLSAILEENGWETTWCRTAEKALEELIRNTFNLIIVDFHLPGMNGDHFCRHVKMDINTRSIPVFMFTIEGSTQSQNLALESGADFFASKEMDRDVLIAKIHSMLIPSKGEALSDSDPAYFHKSRILAVDDSPTFLEYLSVSLKSEGMVIDTAQNGKDALKLVRENDYDCVLLDLVMPEMDGIHVCRELSKLKSMEKRLIVIMMLTAHESKKEMVCALEAGADDFVGKSNDISIIKSRLSALLRRRFIQMDNQRIWRRLKENELKAERARIEKLAAEEKAKIAQKLNDSEERFKRIFQSNSDGLVILNHDGCYLMVNAAAEWYLGKDKTQLIGTPFPYPFKEKEISNIEITPFAGAKKIVEINRSRIPWGEEEAFLLSMRNVTKRELHLKKTAEDLKSAMDELTASQSQLIEAEKLGALGVLAAGIAHELNNPMMGMLNYAQYSLKHVPETNKAFEVLRNMEQETRRCIDIVKNLLTFSRMEKADREPYQQIHCSTMIDRVINLLKYRIEKEGIQVVRSDKENDPVVEARPGNFQQVFLNLIGNAIDALSETADKTLSITSFRKNGNLNIEIGDTGPGIEPGIMESIFNPFFTTKPVGKGTGLGLSVSRSIVETHNGTLTCQSRPGTGTTFTVSLPEKNT